MRIVTNQVPFPHTIIYDYYAPREYSLMFAELHKLKPLMSDKTNDGDPRSNGMIGLSLDKHFRNDRSKSDILTYNRQIFDITERLVSDNPMLNYLDMCNDDLTQINFYPDGSEYQSHADHATISAVTLFCHEPRTFKGGHLKFAKQEYIPNLENNSIILFPSYEAHEVTKTQGTGRFSINQFYFINR